jgi:hypothetical protein
MIIDNSEIVDLDEYAAPFAQMQVLTDEEKKKAETENPTDQDDLPF